MTPTDVLNLAALNLLAADATTLAPAMTANKVSLVVAPFTPGPNLDIASLTLATFTGSTAKLAGVGTQTVARDPISGQWYIQILEPTGGWHWQATVAPSPLQTVYGVVLANNAGSVTYGAELFDTPIDIQAIGDSVNLGNLNLRASFPLFR